MKEVTESIVAMLLVAFIVRSGYDLITSNTQGILIIGDEAKGYTKKDWSYTLDTFDSKDDYITCQNQYSSGRVEHKYDLIAVDEQNVYLSEIYPNAESSILERFDLKNITQQGLMNIASDYWNSFIFQSSDYNILKITDVETNETKYVCGYLIEKTDMIYNFETNELEVYPTSLVFQEENMKEVMQLEEALRKDILAAFHNYLNDNISLNRKKQD